MAKKIEVDEAEFNASVAVVGVVNRMLANPKAKEMVLRARKEVEPNAVIPELDNKVIVESAVSDLSKKFDDFAAGIQKQRDEEISNRAKEDTAAKWRKGQALAKEYGYHDKGLEKLEAFMETEGVFDHRIAIPAFEALHPEPAPVTPGIGGSFDFFSAPIADDAEDIKKLFEARGDDPGAVNSLVNKALADHRGQGGLRI